jgi:hypothetical protein
MQTSSGEQEDAEVGLDRPAPSGVPTVPGVARKNYQRLCAKYPEIMQRLGLDEFSAF